MPSIMAKISLDGAKQSDIISFC